MKLKAKLFPIKKAFTLAEVLIVLAIIGVVAALTIPTLMQKTQDQEYKTAYKKAYSTAQQAWQSAVNNDQDVERVQADTNTSYQNFLAFKAQFKVIKFCDMGSDNSNCWVNTEKYWGTDMSTQPSFIDASGMGWQMCMWCGGLDVFVDTNGLKKPNKFGQDRFVFTIATTDTQANGLLRKIITEEDCTPASTNGCSTNYCPAMATHPCYFKTWLMQ